MNNYGAPTHFLHFPFYSSIDFVEKAEDFTREVLMIDNDYMEFTENKKYHLTVVVLRLNEYQIPQVENM